MARDEGSLLYWRDRAEAEQERGDHFKEVAENAISHLTAERDEARALLAEAVRLLRRVPDVARTHAFLARDDVKALTDA
jgi:hypothetical protein